jgi:uncharacterized protein (DUF2062 family)
MPRRIIRKFIPDPHRIVQRKGLRWLAPIVNDSNLFHLNRYSVSLAFFVGIFVAFIPMPSQMIIAALISLWVRCNLPIAISLVWITNPITMPPMFLGTYLVGTWLLGSETIEFTLSLDLEWWRTEGVKIWKPLIVGSLATGIVAGAISYISIFNAWRWYVQRNWNKRKAERDAAEK